MISETIRHPSLSRQLDCRCWRLKAVQSRHFLSFPHRPSLLIHPGSGILELFVSNTPQHYSPKARWILPRRLRKIGTAVCSQAIRKTTFLPSLPSSRRRYFAAPNEPRLKESTRVAAASRSTLFAVFKNLNAFLSLFSFYLFSPFLYRYSQFYLCTLSEC